MFNGQITGIVIKNRPRETWGGRERERGREREKERGGGNNPVQVVIIVLKNITSENVT